MKRWLTGFFVMSMLITYCCVYALADMSSVPPLIEDTAQTNGMIRVALTSIGGKGTYNLTVVGSYRFNGTTLTSGSKVKVEFVNGTVYVTAGGVRSAIGSSATLNRLSGGVKIAESLVPANTYPGDMRFLYSSGKAYVVCYLYVEDYVYGVLPYEMDNSFPLEALKAQAITARTYAMKAKTTAGVYDVTDTTSHQVFRGVNADKKRCIQAVDETWGIVLKHSGAYITAFYSASNGGQTELNNHVWGGTRQAYYETTEDPFDVSNLQSVKKSYFVYKKPSFGTSVSAYAMIRDALAAKHGGTADGYAIEEITEMVLHTPMYAAPSRLYTKLRVGVLYNGGKQATVDIAIFPTVERGLSLGINNSNNEIYTVEIEDKGFRITARRYGHGVGMSQRGAQQMANDGFSYAQILGFYYAGVERMRMQLTTNWPDITTIPPRVVEQGQAAAGSIAKVSLLDAGNRLNLRKEANVDSEILIRIPDGEEVLAFKQEGDWTQIQYGNQMGYVASDYLVYEAARSQGNGSGIQGSASGLQAIVALPNPNETLNLRQEPSMDAPIVALLSHNTSLAVVEPLAEWTRVNVMGMTGYVLNTFIRYEGGGMPTVQTAPEVLTQRTQWATVALKDGKLNLRSQPDDTSLILTKLANGTQVEVLVSDEAWCAVRIEGQTGYLKREYLAFSYDTPVVQSMNVTQSIPTIASYDVLETPQQAAVGRAYIKTTDGDRVNLRRSPSANATVLVRVPDTSEVEIVNYEAEWSMIKYGGYTGYVSTQFLAFERPANVKAAIAGKALKAGDSLWVVTRDGNGVYLRKEPDQKSKSLALMPYGAEMTVLTPGDPWHKVIYKGLTGYVYAEYTSAIQANTNALLSALIPATESAVMQAQQPVAALQQSPVTTQTLTAAQQQVASAQQQVVGDASTTLLNTGKLRLNSPTATLHLKQMPDDLAADSGTLKHGALVEVLQYYGNDARWLFVQSGSAKGYVLSEHIVLDNPLTYGVH